MMKENDFKLMKELQVFLKLTKSTPEDIYI